MSPVDYLPPPTADAGREYGRTQLSRISSYVVKPTIGLGAIVGFLAYINGRSPGGQEALILAVLVVTIIPWLVIGYANAGSESFTLFPHKLEYTNRTGTSIYALDDIASYSTSPKLSTIHIHFKTPDNKDITFGSRIERYREIEQWLAAHYPKKHLAAVRSPAKGLTPARGSGEYPTANDAPEPDEEVVAAQLKRQRIRQVKQDLLANPDIGVNTNERVHSLRQATILARWLNGAGIVTGLCLWFPPEPPQWGVTAGLVVPLVGGVALWWRPRLLRLDGGDDNGYPSILMAVGLPILGLLASSISYYELLSHAPLWPLAAAVAGGMLLLLAGGSRHFLRQPTLNFTLLSLLLPLALLYGYSACAMANVAYDTAAGEVSSARVLGREMTSGEHQDFYSLRLSAWGADTAASKIAVSYHVYANTEEGDTVAVVVRPGRLGAPWYRVEL